ncbi:inositol polyphosphate 1-phosphatase isoform X2 [Orussus abietinus]|uniref:inositol polyphosphate 1-phosphatase isoform X2 n=1 Tax=Orussus abietinus TaxID=222816 RepID=UPI000626E500|nr:inositol polyphosphate 1-phosphatase isoform X2 [Orussus abietinus]
MTDGSRLLQLLLQVSEKAANIARTCRQNETLFKLLVQEKSEEEKNPRFFHDFKTLADVLIQETIKHDIGLEFPELVEAVKGEESNVFSNTLGETIIVNVCSSLNETADLLSKVLGDDKEAASLLALEVHKDITMSDVPVDSNLPKDLDLHINDLGIWIDPIDSTADYINAIEKVDEETGIHLSGLRCVTVLIGVYLQSTGLPVLGVVNQPFYINKDSQWQGTCYWGYSNNGTNKCSLGGATKPGNVILLSQSENPDIKCNLKKGGFSLIEATGAGYKILSVATGQADAYILSKSSTYRWDTCGPQAVLHSLGGGLINFSEFSKHSKSSDTFLTYSTEGGRFQRVPSIPTLSDYC